MNPKGLKKDEHDVAIIGAGAGGKKLSTCIQLAFAAKEAVHG